MSEIRTSTDSSLEKPANNVSQRYNRLRNRVQQFLLVPVQERLRYLFSVPGVLLPGMAPTGDPVAFFALDRQSRLPTRT